MASQARKGKEKNRRGWLSRARKGEKRNVVLGLRRDWERDGG